MSTKRGSWKLERALRTSQGSHSSDVKQVLGKRSGHWTSSLYSIQGLGGWL